VSAAFCTFYSSDVRFARYKLRATDTKGTTSRTIFSFPVSPGEEEIEAEELYELGVKSEISNRRGRNRCMSSVLVLLFLPISPSIPVSRLFDGLSTDYFTGKALGSLKMNTIAMTRTSLMVWYVSSPNFHIYFSFLADKRRGGLR
jgi:hypothetical protein